MFTGPIASAQIGGVYRIIKAVLAIGSAAPTHQEASSSGALFTHCYQTGQTAEHKVYISDVFATTDVVTVSSRDLSAQRQKLSQDNMPAFHKFLTSNYGEIFAFVTHGSAGCEDPAPQERAELKRAAAIERFQSNQYFKDGLVQTHWVNGPRPAAASGVRSTSGSAAISAEAQDGAAATTFTHCSVRIASSKKIYISELFRASPSQMQGPGQPGQFIRENLAAFYKYLASHYRESSDPRQGRFQGSCATPAPLAQAELQREREKDRYHLNDLYRDGIVETHWANGPVPSANGEQAPSAGPSDTGPALVSSLPPAAGDMTIMDALLAREQRMAPGYCESNDTLHNTYDCNCFADKLHQSRRATAAIGYAAGNQPMLHPDLGQLAATIDLRSCVDPSKATATIDRLVEKAFRSKPAEWRTAVAACASSKYVGQMRSDPMAMKHRSLDETNDITMCRTNSNLR